MRPVRILYDTQEQSFIILLTLYLSHSPAKRRNFWVSGGKFEEMCMEDGSLEKNGSRDEGVAGVRGAGDSGGGSSLM